jgi:hypothetical protein
MFSARTRQCLLWLTLSASFGACGSSDEPTSRRTPMLAAGSGWPSSPTSPVGAAGSSSLPSSEIPLAGNGAVPPAQSTPRNSSSDSVCEVVHLTADPQTPDMMIVLDRSGSMSEGGRWQPSVSAVRRVTTELQSRIRFGLALFPDPAVTDPTGAITSIADCFNQPDFQKCLDQLNTQTGNVDGCAPGKVVVDIADSNAMKIGEARPSRTSTRVTRRSKRCSRKTFAPT